LQVRLADGLNPDKIKVVHMDSQAYAVFTFKTLKGKCINFEVCAEIYTHVLSAIGWLASLVL
jgi:hypothetical protein